jgi:uncharacterized protein
LGLTPFRIYLDSCIAIYLVEEHQAFAAKTETLLENRPDAVLFISDLTVMECLVGPFRSGNRPLEEKFNAWFGAVTVLPITNIAFLEAARLRANHPTLKTPDALHLATALHHSCDEFWTNDTRLDHVVPSFVRNIL